MPYTQDHLLDAIVRGAHAVWERNIHEPETPGEVSDEITRLWDGVPLWGTWLRARCPDGYTRPPDPDWCGIFAAYIACHIGDWLEPGRCVGVGLNPEIARHVMSSTYRLDSSEKWKAAGFDRPEPLSPDQIRGGHIVTVGKCYGTHIVIAADAPDRAGEFPTYEGNAVGIRADGSRGKGVVMRTRNIHDVARVWELQPEHLVGADR